MKETNSFSPEERDRSVYSRSNSSPVCWRGTGRKMLKIHGKKTNIYSWPPSIIQIAPGTKVFLQMMSRHVRRFFELKTIIILLTFFIYLSSFWSRGRGSGKKDIYLFYFYFYMKVRRKWGFSLWLVYIICFVIFDSPLSMKNERLGWTWTIWGFCCGFTS